jgi:hypothetical protein
MPVQGTLAWRGSTCVTRQPRRPGHPDNGARPGSCHDSHDLNAQRHGDQAQRPHPASIDVVDDRSAEAMDDDTETPYGGHVATIWDARCADSLVQVGDHVGQQA